MTERLDPRIQNAIVLYNDQPIDAPDKMNVIVECIEQLLSVSCDNQAEKKGKYNDGNIGKNQK